jgi:hypothetical protein
VKHDVRTLLLCMAIVGTLPLAACTGGADDPVVVEKHLFFSQDNNENGLFEIDLATGAATQVGTGATGTTSNTIGLTETSDPAVLIGSTYSDLATIASDGSGATVVSGSVEAEGLAMNVRTGVLYGAINRSFFSVNPVTGVSTGALATPPADVEGLAADPAADRVYAIARYDTHLFVYAASADTWSTVGDTGISWLNPGLAYDASAGILYAVDATTDNLYRIDPASGASTLVGPLGTNGGGGLAFVLVTR